MRRLKLSIIIMIIFFPCAFFALDLESAVLMALTNREDLSIISNQIILQKKTIESKFHALSPAFSLDLGYSQAYYSNSQIYSNDLNSGVSMNYPIYDGGLKNIEVEEENDRLKLMELEYRMRNSDVICRVKSYFYDIILYQTLLELRKKNLEQSLLEKKNAEILFKQKLIDPLAYKSAGYYSAVSEFQLKQALNELEEKKDFLKNYILYSNFDKLEGNLQQDESFDLSNKLLVDYRIAYLQIQKEMINLYYKKTIASRGWKIDLYSSLYWDSLQSDSLGNYPYNSGFQNQLMLELGIKAYFPISDDMSLSVKPGSAYSPELFYNGFSAKGSLHLMDENNSFLDSRKGYWNSKKQEVDLDYEIRDLESKRNQTQDKLQELKLDIFASSNNMELSLMNYENVEIQYSNNGKTAKELLDAKIQKIESEVSNLRAIYNYNCLVWKAQSFYWAGD